VHRRLKDGEGSWARMRKQAMAEALHDHSFPVPSIGIYLRRRQLHVTDAEVVELLEETGRLTAQGALARAVAARAGNGLATSRATPALTDDS
jgi:hypothetical protein